MIKSWLRRLSLWLESDASKERRYQAVLKEHKANPKEGLVEKIINRARQQQLDELRYLGMLGQKPKLITMEFYMGPPVYIDPKQGIKSYWCGDVKVWQNPDYEVGGKYYEEEKG